MSCVSVTLELKATFSVPLSLMAKICKVTHDFGHPGVDKKVKMVHRRYRLPVPKRQLRDVLSAVVDRCPVCQATKDRRGTQPESNQPYPIPEYPFSSVCKGFCDLVSHPSTHGNTQYDHLLIVVCKLTGYVIAVTCQETLISEDSAEIFLERVVHFAGLPQTNFPEHDHLMNAKFLSTLCSQAGIDVKNSPMYRPRSNRSAE